MPAQGRGPRGRLRLIAAGAVVVLLAAATWVVLAVDTGKQVTASFTSTVGIYPASDVRVLGVVVGTVESVEPRGDRVEVRMTVEEEVKIPAEAGAMVITPSVVADRYVQLAPVYSGGPELADGTHIPLSRTATPVEVDELFESLNELTVALGPKGANSEGAVSEVLEQGASTLAGNGKPLGESIRQLGELARTLSGSKDDLFGTVENLSKFTAMLAANDGQVEQFTEQLASISGVLAEDRDDLAAALAELTDAVGAVQGFVRDNRGKIKSNVDKLAGIAGVLVEQKASLSEALDTAPNALTNLVQAYNPRSGTIDARANLLEFPELNGGGSGSPALPLPLTGTLRSAGGAR
ncbi:MCE family protein [Amycolatopsis marina]|uniref:MCE family protein n=1 Tax=Amycolatopsis marina TaxID=490629 RepID=UPI001FEA6D9D|nr:MCE family protein [Amycolatopsis marina]